MILDKYFLNYLGHNFNKIVKLKSNCKIMNSHLMFSYKHTESLQS